MPLFSHTFLRGYLRQHLTAVGVDADAAATVADNLVEASLKGHDSHGVTLLPRYVAAIRAGELAPDAGLRLVRDEEALLSFRGDLGFGQVLGKQAMERAIARAQRLGVAIVGLAEVHHLGRIGAFAEQVADAGLVSIHFANVSARALVLPFNGVKPRLGTNPFCVGIPVAGRSPVILDFATSAIAGNKARIAWNEGRQLPPGCVVDNQGNPSQDPRWLMEEPLGALLAFGGHKGAGLSLICSLLGAALVGGETESRRTTKGVGIINNMLSIVFDPARLGAAETYQAELLSQLEYTSFSEDGCDVLLPGEAELRQYRQREQDGIAIDEVSWRQFQALDSAQAVTR